jgi:hypothetical protein
VQKKCETGTAEDVWLWEMRSNEYGGKAFILGAKETGNFLKFTPIDICLASLGERAGPKQNDIYQCLLPNRR